MSALQHRLSEFLELELYHSLGAYRRASDELRDLEKRIEEDRVLAGETSIGFLSGLVSIMREYNHMLDDGHDVSDPSCRHPSPPRLPLSPRAAFLPGRASSGPDATARQSLSWVGPFYEAAVYAIDAPPPPDEGDDVVPFEIRDFQRSLLIRRAEFQQATSSSAFDPFQQAWRRERYRRRGIEAIESGIPHSSFSEVAPEDAADADAGATVATIVHSHLECEHRRPLAAFVMRALVDAHLALHEVESYRSAPLGVQLDRNAPEAQRVLRRSIALNTFVWSAARTAPWIFAEDDTERRHIVMFYPRAWRNIMPMRAMWISAQVALLALHRRAYAYTLLGDARRAYNDFHKLQRNVRQTLRRLQHTSIHVQGALEFLEGLDALADHHIGELYWCDRDHISALTHFQRAQRRMERLKRDKHTVVVTNSRWFVQLQLSLARACYELGRHKASLAWYLRTWRSVLELVAGDTAGEIHADAIDAAVEWLERIVDEPELHKRDVVINLRPVIEQLEAIRIDPRFTAVASDVILGMGHLLFVLSLQDDVVGEAPPPAMDLGDPLHGASLAQQCIRRAAQLDAGNTQAHADLLKLHFRASRKGQLGPSPELERAVTPKPPVAEQWPGGATGVEGMSRAVEYVLQQQLRLAPSPRGREQRLARELMHNLLTHTDSIEARRSQVHDYLSRPPQFVELPRRDGAPAIEFVCLRRYSSAFPILPRPHDFRSHGGGYFIRCHPSGKTTETIGIAVDPGTTYVECLYRAGYALSDIDVVIVTHDHVDHASSLEPLLAVRWEMRQLEENLKPLLVLGNKSMEERWSKLALYHGDSSLRFASFGDDLEEVSRGLTERLNALRKGEDAAPAELVLRGLSSELIEGVLAHNDVGGHPAFGFELTLSHRGESRRLTFTSDLPSIPEGYAWPEDWSQALSADVVVCHVSSVPLSELRRMAKFGELRAEESDKRSEAARIRDDIAWIEGSWDRDGLGARLKYAYWLKGSRDEHGRSVTVPPVGPGKVFRGWCPPEGHPYLRGLLRIASDYAARRGARAGLLILGELSEELGSFRPKIASQLNRVHFEGTYCRAMTADIGLRVLVTVGEGREITDVPVRVNCSACELDNDAAPVERFHAPAQIYEVCVKGENEGMFYNCAEHDPAGQTADPTFIERLERYDVFGR